MRGAKMRKVKVICDSTADLNPKDYEQYNIEVLPLEVNFGEESFLDGVDITPDQVYRRVEESKENLFPKTSAASPSRFENIFRKWVDQGYDVIYTGIGGKMSTSYKTACIVAKDFDNHVFVVDSASLSTGTGLLVLKMCKYRDEGKSAEEIFNLVNALVKNVNAQFVIDKLDYLHRGGRCSGATKLFGHLLSIHPNIKVVDGAMVVYKKPRGKFSKCLDVLIEDLKNDYPNIDTDHIMVTHSGCAKEDIDRVRGLVKEVMGEDVNIMETRAGCVVSSHCGPNTIGILYIKK